MRTSAFTPTDERYAKRLNVQELYSAHSLLNLESEYFIWFTTQCCCLQFHIVDRATEYSQSYTKNQNQRFAEQPFFVYSKISNMFGPHLMVIFMESYAAMFQPWIIWCG